MNGKFLDRFKKTRDEDFTKVLHVWDMAGVGSLLCKHLMKNDYTAKMIMRKSHDPFKMTEFYNQESLDMGGQEFLNYALKIAKDFGIIHVHGIYQLIPKLRKKYPNKKLIIHHHGSEVSECSDNEFRFRCTEKADLVICATPDIMKFCNNPILIENPVDTEIFRPLNCTKKENALYINIRYIDFNEVKKYLASNCPWSYDVFDREKNYLSFSGMPNFLNQYKKFIDVKILSWTNGSPTQAYSKSGLEALACGLEVFNYQNQIVRGLPEKHEPEIVVKKLIDCYKKLVE